MGRVAIVEYISSSDAAARPTPSVSPNVEITEVVDNAADLPARGDGLAVIYDSPRNVRFC